MEKKESFHRLFTAAKPPTVRKTLRVFFRTAEILVSKHAGWYEQPVHDLFNAMYHEGFRARIDLMWTSRLARRVALEAWVRDIWERKDEEEEMGEMKETVMGYFEDVLEEVKVRMEGWRPDEEREGGTDTIALLCDAQIKAS